MIVVPSVPQNVLGFLLTLIVVVYWGGDYSFFCGLELGLEQRKA